MRRCKTVYALMRVSGNQEHGDASFAVLALDAELCSLLGRRTRLAHELRGADMHDSDESFSHLVYHGYHCTWLQYSDELDALLGDKDAVLLDTEPQGEGASVDACYTSAWQDGDTDFTGYQKHADDAPQYCAVLTKDLLAQATRQTGDR